MPANKSRLDVTGVSEQVRNKRHDKRDRKLNETKEKSVGPTSGGELWGRRFTAST